MQSGQVRFWLCPGWGHGHSVRLLVVHMVLARLHKFSMGNVWGVCVCVFVVEGGINSPYNMFKNDVFWCKSSIPFLGGAWSHWIGKFSDSPSESSKSTPSPSHPYQNTMHVVLLCKMNRRMEEREFRRSRTACCALTTQSEGAWAGAAVKSWGLPWQNGWIVHWRDRIG